jgi:hypothetical protein
MYRLIRRALLPCLFVASLPLHIAHAAMTTPGQFGVSPSGAATYTIPIQVPPGTAGIEPKLALSYNSQGGNGLLGVGWSLSGLSAIGRCPQTMAQDGVRGAVNYDNNDRYCLDGQRLIAVHGIDGADGTEYRTELDSFAKIMSYGSAGSACKGSASAMVCVSAGPAWFKVWTKSGQVMEYGNTGDARIEAQGKATVRVWALNRLQDTKGNYLTVSYTEDNANGDYYPQRIDYAGNASLNISPNNSIVFVTASRSDTVSLYQAGSRISNTAKLTNIKTYANGVLVRDYQLAYDQSLLTQRSTQRERMSSVRECTGNGTTCFPAASWSWNDSSAPIFGDMITSNVIDWGYDSGRSWVDFNGDGKADYCRVTGTTNGQSSYATCTLSAGTAFVHTIISAVIDWGYEAGRAWVDFNGDGRADYCRIVGSTNGQSSAVACTLSAGEGFGQTIVSGVIDWGHEAGRAWVDINGDSLPDYCRRVGDVNNQSSSIACTLSTGTGFGQTITSGVIDWGYDAGRAWVDVNGDGRADYCRVVGDINGQSSRVACTLSTGEGFGQTITSDVLDWGYEAGRAWADVNGDGLADYCRLIGSSGSMALACTLSAGSGFGQTITSTVLDGGYDSGRFWVDVNGDGMTDYCRMVGDLNNQSSAITCTLSTGTGFGQTIASGVVDWGYEAGRGWADVQGDGKVSYCRLVGNVNGQSSHAVCNSIGYGNQTIANIRAGLGQKTAISYKPLTAPDIYLKGADAIFPIVDLQSAFYVVSALSSSNGTGGTLTSNYSYGELKADTAGRGLLGFRWMQMVQAETGVASCSEFSQSWPYVGSPLKITKTISNGGGSGGFLSQMTNTYNCTDFVSAKGCTVSPGKHYFPFVSKSVEASWDYNGVELPAVATETTYDTWNDSTKNWDDLTKIYGNVRKVVVSSSDGFVKTTINSYADDVPAWHLGRLTKAMVTSSNSDSGAEPLFLEPRTSPACLSPAALSALYSRNIALQVSSNQIQLGQTLTLTATVSGPDATGAVSFYDNGVLIGTAAVNPAGVATFTAELAFGSHNFTANYSGDSSNFSKPISSSELVLAGNVKAAINILNILLLSFD